MSTSKETTSLLDRLFFAIEHDLLVLFDYFEMIHGQIEELEKIEKKKIEKQYQRDEFNDTAEFFKAYEQRIGKLRTNIDITIPQLLSYSFITMLYSSFEFITCDIADALKKSLDIKIELKIIELSGNFIQKAKKYFSVFFNLNLDTKSPEYAKIIMLQTLRNAVVHHNGHWEAISDGNQSKINSYMENFPTDLRLESGKLWFSEDFCEKLGIDVLEWVSGLIMQALDKAKTKKK